MRQRANREINVITMSALDLFASAMGAFMIIALTLSPEPTPPAPPDPAPKPEQAIELAPIDLVFMIDTSGSMGRGIDQFRGGLLGIVSVLRELAPSVRIGIVAYKGPLSDGSNRYDVLTRPLADVSGSGLDALKQWADARLEPSGGGDEVVLQAMQTAVAMDWNGDAANIIVMVADEPGLEDTKPAIDRLVSGFRARSPLHRVSGYESPAGEIDPQYQAYMQMQREAARRWMRDFARLGEGIFVEPSEGDLSSTTLLTVLLN